MANIHTEALEVDNNNEGVQHNNLVQPLLPQVVSENEITDEMKQVIQGLYGMVPCLKCLFWTIFALLVISMIMAVMSIGYLFFFLKVENPYNITQSFANLLGFYSIISLGIMLATFILLCLLYGKVRRRDKNSANCYVCIIFILGLINIGFLTYRNMQKQQLGMYIFISVFALVLVSFCCVIKHFIALIQKSIKVYFFSYFIQCNIATM